MSKSYSVTLDQLEELWLSGYRVGHEHGIEVARYDRSREMARDVAMKASIASGTATQPRDADYYCSACNGGPSDCTCETPNFIPTDP